VVGTLLHPTTGPQAATLTYFVLRLCRCTPPHSLAHSLSMLGRPSCLVDPGMAVWTSDSENATRILACALFAQDCPCRDQGRNLSRNPSRFYET
jgi:hypothetical protein